MKKIAAVGLALVLSVGVPTGTAFADKPDKADRGNSQSAPGQTKKASSEPSYPGETGPDEGDNKHPSGKDRSVEPGGSGDQGKSPSDPDGQENGGADKPGGPGGVDKGDQDGNNGCGNDDDFEDDNNGNCGGKPKPDKPIPPVNPEPPVKPKPPVVEEPPVLIPPVVIEKPVTPSDVTPPVIITEAYSGAKVPVYKITQVPVERSVATPTATSLPYTGGETVSLLTAATGLVMLGTAAAVAGRRRLTSQ